MAVPALRGCRTVDQRWKGKPELWSLERCSRIFTVLEHSKLEHGSVVDTEPVDAEGLGCAVSGDPCVSRCWGGAQGSGLALLLQLPLEVRGPLLHNRP